jgi:hypothetical protein
MYLRRRGLIQPTSLREHGPNAESATKSKHESDSEHFSDDGD